MLRLLFPSAVKSHLPWTVSRSVWVMNCEPNNRLHYTSPHGSTVNIPRNFFWRTQVLGRGTLLTLFRLAGDIWISKLGWIPWLACFVPCMQWIPQINAWCNACWLLGCQHCGRAVCGLCVLLIDLSRLRLVESCFGDGSSNVHLSCPINLDKCDAFLDLCTTMMKRRLTLLATPSLTMLFMEYVSPDARLSAERTEVHYTTWHSRQVPPTNL